MREEISPELERIGAAIVDSAYKVHSTLGPGLLESVYQQCLFYELEKRGFQVEREVPVQIVYDAIKFPAAFRMDLLVEGSVIIEIKACERFDQVHAAQTLTYMKLTHRTLGYLINFNVPQIRDGIKRFARSNPK